MTAPSFSFRVTHTDGRARRGVMTTAHGAIETPAFMPVGTQGAVKAITHRDLAGRLRLRVLHLSHISRAYLRHLFLAGEIAAATLNTLHNLNFYLDTMRGIRDAIAFGRFESFRLAFHQRWSRQAVDS